MQLTDIYRAFHPNTKELSLLLSTSQNTSPKLTIVSHKASLNKCKKIQITPSNLSNHRGFTLDFNSNKNNRKPTN